MYKGQKHSMKINDMATTKELSKELRYNAVNEGLVWTRTIKKYSSRFRDEHEAWKEIVHKTQNEYLEKLANSMQEFSKSKLKKLTMMEGYLKILVMITIYRNFLIVKKCLYAYLLLFTIVINTFFFYKTLYLVISMKQI